MQFRLTACFLVFATLQSASVHGQSLGSQGPPSDPTSLAEPQPQESGVTAEPQLRADIDRMIEVAHLRERIIEISRLRFEQVRPQLTASMPPTPNRDKILLEYAEKYTSLHSTSDYMNKVAGVYAKYFSDEDIKGMIQFYQTPAGQHYIAKIPQVTADIAQLAESAAAEGIPHIWKQLCREYPELRGKLKYCIEPDTERKSLLTNPAFDPQSSQFARMPR
ncbi:MAG: DUF2059 domain-containing protein [Candidatus Acidiferrales bacterium]